MLRTCYEPLEDFSIYRIDPEENTWLMRGDDEWSIEQIIPYLRPMSSMTKEEEEELKVLTDNKFSLRFDGSKIINMPIREIDGGWHCGSFTSSVDSFDIIILIDWLNANHFDYRGLIPMGLALEAPEGMYD